MTKPEMITALNNLCYTGIAGDLMFIDWYTYKPENYALLKECMTEIPELRIYDDLKKFRLITKIKRHENNS